MAWPFRKRTSTPQGEKKKKWGFPLTSSRNLHEKDALYRLLLETLPQGVFLKDPQLRYLSLNQQYAWMLGQDVASVLGKRDDEIGGEAWASRFLRDDQRVLDSGQDLEYEEALHVDGEIRWFRNIKKRLMTTSGEVLGVMGIVEDISDRKKAELQVKQSEALFRSTYTQAAVGMAICDKTGLLLDVNAKFCQIAGVDEAQLVGKQLLYQVFSDPEVKNEKRIWEGFVSDSHLIYSHEKSFKKGDGVEAWVNLSLSRIEVGTEEGRYLVVAEDITSRKKAEIILDADRVGLESLVAQRTSELKLSEEKARALFKAVPVPTFTLQNVAGEFILIDFNDSAYGFTRGQALEMMGKNQTELFPTLKLEDRLLFVLRSKSILSEIIDFTSPPHNDTKTLSVKYAFVPPDLVMVHMEDISALKRAEIAQIEARHQAEEAAKSKSEFLANMSHEIRTPMNAVLGLSHLLFSTPLNDKQQEYVAHLQKSAQLLLGLLNDILDFSKIEAGRLQLEKIVFNPAQTLVSTLEIGRLQAEEKGLTYEVVLDPQLPETVMGDPLRLDQIVLNLVNNAVKFTQQGMIRIEVTILSPQDFQVSVKDTGVGISDSQLKNLFKPFTQADGSTTRRFGGTGLGLVITKSLTEMMGGRIEVESHLGQGSVFKVIFPFEVGESGGRTSEKGCLTQEKKATDYAPIFKGKRILLVEDNPVNQLVAKEILKKREVEVEVAFNGQVAIDMLGQEPKFDAVLLDIQMPILDGYATAEKVRKELKLLNLPLIAMTAHATEEDRQRCLQAGMNDYLSKPVVPEKLWNILGRWL